MRRVKTCFLYIKVSEHLCCSAGVGLQFGNGGNAWSVLPCLLPLFSCIAVSSVQYPGSGLKTRGKVRCGQETLA